MGTGWGTRQLFWGNLQFEFPFRQAKYNARKLLIKPELGKIVIKRHPLNIDESPSAVATYRRVWKNHGYNEKRSGAVPEYIADPDGKT